MKIATSLHSNLAFRYLQCGYAKKTHSYLYQLRRSFKLGIKKVRKIFLCIFMNNITHFLKFKTVEDYKFGKNLVRLQVHNF